MIKKNIRMTLYLLLLIVFLIGCEAVNEGDALPEGGKVLSKINEYQLEFNHIMHPDKESGHVFFSAITENGSQLIDYNLKLNKEKVIFETEYDHGILQQIMGNEDWLIWIDTTEDASENKIYTLNKRTQEKNIISKSNPQYVTIDAPFLYEDYVAWMYLDNDSGSPQPVLKLYDLKNEKETVVSEINDYGLYNNFIHMGNDKLVWTDRKDDQGFYYIYDLKSQEMREFPSPFKFPAYAMIGEDKIFALHFEDFTDWGNQKFGYFDIEKEEYMDISQVNESILLFRVFQDNLTVLDEKGKLKNFIIEEDFITENEELELPQLGIENVRYTSNGELIFNYSGEKSDKNFLVIVE